MYVSIIFSEGKSEDGQVEYMGVSKNRGIWKPPKWMVKIMENPIKMDDLGVPLCYIYINILQIRYFR